MSIYNETTLFDDDKCIGGSYGWTTLVSDGELEVPDIHSHSARAIANARLWDAAPELLEALQQLARPDVHTMRCAANTSHFTLSCDCYYGKALAAIAQATGVQP